VGGVETTTTGSMNAGASPRTDDSGDGGAAMTTIPARSPMLIVEDDPAVGSLIQSVLDDEGYPSILAGNGRVALRQLTTTHPQLIICDLLMPAMDGITFCRHVQADPALAHIPILVCSAGKEELITGQCQYAAFLRKPFTISQLLATIQRILHPSTPT
jgi:CheY-like chemotaxis protein